MSNKYYNPLGYACLNPGDLQKVMGKVPDQFDLIDPYQLSNIEDSLNKQFNVPIGVKKQDNLYSGDFFVPPLLDNTIDGHFEKMAEELVSMARPGINELVGNGDVLWFAEISDNGFRINTNEDYEDYKEGIVDLVIPDKDYLFKTVKPFWTRYEWNKERHDFDVTHPEYPLEQGIVFDVETYVQGSHFAIPVLASGVHPTCVYIWVHPALLDDNAGYGYDPITHKLNPHESPLPKLGKGKFIVCHSIQYDFTRYEERYEFTNTPNNFGFCTQSAHTLCAGLASSQRWAANLPDNVVKPKFLHYGSAKGLVAAYNFHVPPETGCPKINPGIKKIRDAFVDAPNLAYLREMLPDLLSYSLKDPVYTLQLFQALWPKYKKHAPSNVVLAAHFLLAHSLIPVADDWFDWINTVEEQVTALEKEQRELFIEIAQDALQWWYDGGDPTSDPWFKNMNWSIAGILSTPMGQSLNDERVLHECVTVQDFLDFGVEPIPKWFKHCNEGKDLTAKKVDAHYLLKLSYRHKDKKYYPLEKTQEMGWCYLDSEGDRHRVPHKSGEDENVGSVLTSTYGIYFADGRLKSEE